MWKSGLAVLLVCLMAACTKPADPDSAERAVPQFHTAFLDKDLQGIYQRASDELKKQHTQQDFVAYLEKVQRNLGEVRSTDRTATNVEGTLVTLTYKSTYASATAIEEFVIRQDEGKDPQLVAYRVLEPALK